MKKILVVLLFIFTLPIFAAPKEIVIVRHGDKLEQAKPGPTLSPKGMERSIKLAFYFLNKFGVPDFIFAANPTYFVGKNSSIRELQTVAPLANMIAAQTKTEFPIMHPYQSSDYAKLAHDLLTNKAFNGKQVLVCWNHTQIPQLAEQLGVKQRLGKWPADDFDSVYVLSYDQQGKLKGFNVLHRQYEVLTNESWEQLYSKFK